MLDRIIENFPVGTAQTAKRLLATGMNAGERIGEQLSDIIDSAVDHFIK